MPRKSKKGKSPHPNRRTSSRIKSKSRKQKDHEEYISYDSEEVPIDIVLSCNDNAKIGSPDVNEPVDMVIDDLVIAMEEKLSLTPISIPDGSLITSVGCEQDNRNLVHVQDDIIAHDLATSCDITRNSSVENVNIAQINTSATPVVSGNQFENPQKNSQFIDLENSPKILCLTCRRIQLAGYYRRMIAQEG